MSRDLLGGFELIVLSALLGLEDAAYGVPIAAAIEESTGRPVLMASVYAALERLEAKGFVSSALGPPTAARGGRAKKFFRITKSGLRQVRDARRALLTLWQECPQLEGNG